MILTWGVGDPVQRKGGILAGSVRSEAYRAFLTVLVRARSEAGLSQAALARRLGKPPSFVGKYELGERRLDLVETLVLLKVLGVEASAFLEVLAGSLPEDLSGD